MIIKRRHTKSFVTLENALVRDRRLSLDEHGMLHYLLSLPDDWEVSRAHCAKFWRIGRDKAARIFRNLRRFGWAQVERIHGEDGTFLGVRWVISDEPGEEVPDAEIEPDVEAETEADADEETIEAAAEPVAAPIDVANHDTENPGHGSTVVRLTHTPEKAYHGYNIDSKKTDSEENRLPQRGGREKSIEGSEITFASFSDLVSLWPSDNILSRTAAEQAWQRLGKVPRQHAFKVASRYLSDCSHNSRKVCDLTTYLREERFERFVASPQRGSSFLAKPGSAQWHRWREYRVATNQLVAFMDQQASRGVGWTVPAEWPPALPPESKIQKGKDTTGPPVAEISDEDAKAFR